MDWRIRFKSEQLILKPRDLSANRPWCFPNVARVAVTSLCQTIIGVWRPSRPRCGRGPWEKSRQCVENRKRQTIGRQVMISWEASLISLLWKQKWGKCARGPPEKGPGVYSGDRAAPHHRQQCHTAMKTIALVSAVPIGYSVLQCYLTYQWLYWRFIMSSFSLQEMSNNINSKTFIGW